MGKDGLVQNLGKVTWLVLLSGNGERVRQANCENWRTRVSLQTPVCLAAALTSPASSRRGSKRAHPGCQQWRRVETVVLQGFLG